MNYFEEQHRASLSSYILENNLEAIPDQTTEIAAAQLGGAVRVQVPGLASGFSLSFTQSQMPDSRFQGGVCTFRQLSTSFRSHGDRQRVRFVHTTNSEAKNSLFFPLGPSASRPKSHGCGHAHIPFAASTHWLLISSDDPNDLISLTAHDITDWKSQCHFTSPLTTTIFGRAHILKHTFMQWFFSDSLIFVIVIRYNIGRHDGQHAASMPRLQQQVTTRFFTSLAFIRLLLFEPKHIMPKTWTSDLKVSWAGKNKHPPSRRHWENHGEPNLITMDHMWNRDKISWWGEGLGGFRANSRSPVLTFTHTMTKHRRE